MTLPLTADTVYADGPSANPSQPIKAMIRRLLRGYEDVLNAGLSNGGLIYDTKASMNADLAHPANASAWVVDDATAANNGIYRKSGASGSGSWAKIADLPYSVIYAQNAGTGTANAVVATSSLPVSASAYSQLVSVPFTAENTGAMTLSINGETARALVTNIGAAIPSGYVSAGMSALVQIDGDGNYRLFSYGDATAVQAAAEAAQAAAEAAAASLIKRDTVALLVSDAVLAYSAGTGKTVVAAGQIIEAGGYRYEVAASGASDQHLTTAGGVKLYVMSVGGFFPLGAFGATQDGTADDTLALLAGFAAARSGSLTLLIGPGRPRFVADSVPVGVAVDHGGNAYVSVSNMTATAETTLVVDGKVYFDTTDLTVTRMSGFDVETIGHELDETGDPNTIQPVFRSFGGAKTLVAYDDVHLTNEVTDLTGVYRGSWLLLERDAAHVRINRVSAANATVCMVLQNCSDIVVRDPAGTNIQTVVWLISPRGYEVTGIRLVNTKGQADHWIGRTNASPRANNGCDGILVEDGLDGWVDDIRTEWAIERGCYIQGSRQRVTRGHALNSGGWKVVGSGYAAKGKTARLNDCHVVLDADYEPTLGRVNLSVTEHYWIDDVETVDCTATNDSAYPTAIIAIANLSTKSDGSTVNDLTLRRCGGDALRTVYTQLSPLTAAQMAALTPAGSFLTVKGLIEEDCWLNKPAFRAGGSLLDHRTVGASADALATYVAQDVTLRRNTITLPANNADRDDWLFNPNYVNGIVSEDNRPNLPFFNSYFTAAPVSYAAITMREPNLRFAIDPGTLWTKLANLALAAGSSLVFSQATASQQQRVTAKAAAAGAPKAIQLQASGTGYLQVTTAVDTGIEMRGSGAFYAGKRVGAAITDQVGTKPVGITSDAATIFVRGDLSPTVTFDATLTAVL